MSFNLGCYTGVFYKMFNHLEVNENEKKPQCGGMVNADDTFSSTITA